MTRDDVLQTLRAHQGDLEARKITSLALFGSFARGDAGPDSDVDLLFEYDVARAPGLFELMETREYLVGLLNLGVDLVPSDGLKPMLRPNVERDAVRAF